MGSPSSLSIRTGSGRKIFEWPSLDPACWFNHNDKFHVVHTNFQGINTSNNSIVFSGKIKYVFSGVVEWPKSLKLDLSCEYKHLPGCRIRLLFQEYLAEGWQANFSFQKEGFIVQLTLSNKHGSKYKCETNLPTQRKNLKLQPLLFAFDFSRSGLINLGFFSATG
jgi:hypothetical protein